MKTIKVKISGDKTCNHGLEPPQRKYSLKKNEDGFRWKVENNCNISQQVLFCVYDEAGTLRDDAFEETDSKPPGLAIGTAFTVEPDEKARLDCVARKAGRFEKLVLVGTEVPPAGKCPRRLKKPIGPLTHQLEVEILP